MDKKDEEQHSMSKPKPLEVISDGDLTEIKKDPIWKTWLEKSKKIHPFSKDPWVGIYVDPQGKKHTGTDAKMQPTDEEQWKGLKELGFNKPRKKKKGALGALGEGKLNRRTGKPMKLLPRKTDREEKPTKKGQKRLEDFKSDSDYYMDAGGNPQRKEKKYTPKHPMTRVHNRESELRQEQHPHKRLLGEPDKTKPHKFCPTCGDKMPIETRRRVEEKADYFVEEIKANIIYYDKIFPLIGMIAGQVARGVGGAAKKIGGGLLQDVGEVGQGMMEQEEEEQ